MPGGGGAIGIAMRQAGVYVLASLVSGVLAALILASGPSYTEARSLQGTAYNVNRGQSTYNGCQASPCQVAYLNTVEDFCLWAPAQLAVTAARNTEHTLVAWCMKSAHGTHLIPDGTISGARLVITPEYVQITGVGNLTNINVPADGVASASGEGDRLHGFVFTRAFGQLEQIYDWTSFVSQERFCFRACKPSATASTICPQIYDSFGCSEDAPGNYDTGVFEDCIRDATEVPLTLYQEVFAAPSHYSTRPSSGCTIRGTISNAQVAPARRAVVSTSDSTLSALVTLSSHLLSRSHGHGTPLTSSIAPTTTDTATRITFPPFPTSTLTITSFMSSSTPVSSDTPTSTPYSYSYTHTHSNWHSRTRRRSRHLSSTSSTSVSSSPHQSFTRSRSSSSTASPPSPLIDPSTSSTSFPASSTPSFTLTFTTYSSSDPSSSVTSTSTSTPTLSSTTSTSMSNPSSSVTSTFTSTPTLSFTPTPTSSPTLPSTPTSTSSFPSSSNGTSSSLSELSSAQPSSSTPSSTTTPTSSLTSLSVAPLTSSQSSDVLTFTTSHSPSSLPTTSSATSSTTFPNSQSQISSQCPPASQVAVNAGSVVPSPTPLLPLILTILMIVISSSVGVLVH